MNDSMASILDARPVRRVPVRTFVLVLVCWGGVFAFLDSWVECRALLGLSIPETASLVGALGIGGMMAVVLAFTDDHVGRRSPSSSDDRAGHASPSTGELSKRSGSTGRHWRGAFLFASLTVLIVLTWHGAMREYDTALSRIGSGECVAHR